MKFSCNLFHVNIRSSKLYTMATSILYPPNQVKCMKDLKKDLFNKMVKVPCLKVEKSSVATIIPVVKKYLLKLEHFKSVEHSEGTVTIYLHPDKVKDWTSISCEDTSHLLSCGLSQENFNFQNITLTYDNYSYDTVLKSVLPEDIDGFSSFTKIGHILHLNLKDHLIPYKKLIGDVLLDKVKNCRSVVNKIDMIDNTYRNFQMEVLSGDDDMITCVKENGCLFEFDFSTVYWNSRLCTEHERIIETIKSGDLFIDVFAGVGPFSIPISKKKCVVHANDLNPESYKWMNHNIKKNKVKLEYITCYNMDGKDFIELNIKSLLLEYINKINIYIAMNLPALAVEFLPYFIGLLKDNPIKIDMNPIVYVYCFAKGSEANTDYKSIAKNLVLQSAGPQISDKIIDMFEVRTVSNFKKMMRITFKLDEDILINSKDNLKRKTQDADAFPTKILKCTYYQKYDYNNLKIKFVLGKNGKEKDE